MRSVMTHLNKALLVAVICAWFVGCSSVPKEVVELSYQIGTDLDVLHGSYDAMVVDRFNGFRAKREQYLEEEWIPMFLADFIKNGKLVETAKGSVVWSDEADDFVVPTPGREQAQLLATIREWSNAAIAEIRVKRSELIDPLNEQEISIRRDLDEAFTRIRTANTYITAHLNSIREVEEVQAQALDKIGLADIVRKLDVAIADVSKAADAGLQKIREADGFVDDVVTSGTEFIDVVTGEN